MGAFWGKNTCIFNNVYNSAGGGKGSRDQHVDTLHACDWIPIGNLLICLGTQSNPHWTGGGLKHVYGCRRFL